MRTIDLTEVTEMMTAISHYRGLPSMFTQLDPKQSEKLKEFWDKAIKHGNAERQYIDYYFLNYWNSIDLYNIQQTWNNTSGGWQGMGGAAFSTDYTTVIVNWHLEAFFVYYSGKLAYVAYINEKSIDFINKDRFRLPGLRDAQKKLDLIYTYKY